MRQRHLRWSLFIFALICSLFSPCVFGQLLPREALTYNSWRTYTTADNLPSNNIQALAYREEPLDFPRCDAATTPDCPSIPGLWVGTDRGLTYLNGRTSTTFDLGLPSSHVLALRFAPDGRLWVATTEGLTWLDADRKPSEQPLLAGHKVLSLTQINGYLWAGRETGLDKINPATGVTAYTYLPGSRITALPTCPMSLPNCNPGRDRTLWIGTDHGLFRLELGQKAAKPQPFGTEVLPSTKITALTLAGKGIWVGTDKGAFYWNGSQWTENFIGQGELASPSVRAIDLDNQGRVWFATDAGTSRWSPDRRTWRRFFAFRAPIVSDDVQALLIDTSGTAWMGTDQGLSGTDGSLEMLNAATTFPSDAALRSKVVRAITREPTTGRTWVGTSVGIAVYNHDREQWYTLTTENSQLLDNDVDAFAFDSSTNRMWVGTSGGGITIFNSDLSVHSTVTEASGGLPHDNVLALTHDPSTNRMWVGTSSGGLAVLNADLSIHATITQASGGLPHDNVRALTHDPSTNRMWVGTLGGGLAVFNADLSIHATITQASGGLPHDNVRALTHDPITNRMWVGTWGGGLAVFNADLSIHAIITQASGGLPHDNVLALTHDPITNRMWVGTWGGGLVVLNADLSIHAIITQASGGLPHDNVRALTHDPITNRMWVGTWGGGLAVFNADLSIHATITQASGGLPHDNVRALTHDPITNRMWVGTWGGGLAVLNADLSIHATITQASGGLPDNDVLALTHDPITNRMWVGTSGGGLAVFNADLSIHATITQASGGLPDNDVLALTHDPITNRMWVGTLGGGLVVLNADLSIHATITQASSGLPDNDVLALTHDPITNRMWVGTLGGGLAVFNADLSIHATITQASGGLPDNDVLALTHDPITNRMWVGTLGGGLAVFNADLSIHATVTQASGGLPNDNVLALTHDPITNRMWVGTWGDITILNPDLTVLTQTTNGLFDFSGLFMSTMLASLSSLFVNSIAIEPSFKRLWTGFSYYFGLFRTGLIIFDIYGKNPWIKFDQATIYNLSRAKLLDTSEIKLTFEGGDLIVPPLGIGYHFSLTDLDTAQLVDEKRLAPGGVGTISPGQITFGQTESLAYHRHELTVTLSTVGLKTYTLPPIEFDVQASPKVVLTRVSNFDLKNLAEQTFSSETPFAIAWQVTDADAQPNETITIEFAWDYTGNVDAARWQPATEQTTSRALVQPVSMPPGEPDQRRTLAVRVIDADGNPSEVATASLIFRAPLSFGQLITPYAITLGLALCLLGGALVTLSRTSGLPVRLLFRQGITHWLPVGTGYRRYRSQWAALSPLERLLILLAPSAETCTRDQLQSDLAERQTPVPPERVERSLESLVRQQLLTAEANTYGFTEPGLARALQQHQGEAGLVQLADRVRSEHPLFVETQRFFSQAGFDISAVANDPLALLCQPTASAWQQLFQAPVYARLFPDQPLGRDAVDSLYQAAQTLTHRADVLFAIVNQAPLDSGWIEIGALKAAADIQIIPIDDAMIQHGREQQKERQTLQTHLRRFLRRQRDLYHVRDPVADRLNFFGREARATELLETLSEGRPVALFGLRKMGKSSLLQYMRDHAPFPVAYVDLQAGIDLALLYRSILKSWQTSLRVKAEPFNWEPRDLSSNDPSTSFTTVVRELMSGLEANGFGARLGLFVDEIELIVPQHDDQHHGPEPDALVRYLAFARALRGLVQETDQLSLMVVGVDPQLNRINRWAGQQNPFYQFFQEEYLMPLSREDCIQMVRNIGRQMGLVYSDAAVDFIAGVSGGHPFMARQLCSVTYRASGLETSGEITLEQLQAAAGRFIREPATAALLDESGLWGEVTTPELWPPPQIRENEAVLKSLATVEEASEDTLLTAAAERPARERSLFELEQRAVLGRLEASLHIQFGLFRNWIRRYKHE